MESLLIAVTGPTGAGKSALALHLAGSVSGEIVNYDSLQLYRGFDIGTAKPSLQERHAVPHHLFDVVDLCDEYSAGDYSRDAREIIANISARGAVPILVGGTGFYLRALLDGLPALPPRDPDLRARLAAREQARPGSVHRLLSRLEPDAARRIHPHDLQKSIRALEIRLLTREPLPHPGLGEPLRGYRILKLGLDPDRARLVERLDARVCAMFSPEPPAGGILEEVRRWLARGATGSEKPFDSLGYRQALEVLRGQSSLQQAISSTQIETRQYAKRQWTWFRRDASIRWLRGFGDSSEIAAEAAALVRAFQCGG